MANNSQFNFPLKVRGAGGVILLVLILGSVWHQKAFAPTPSLSPPVPLGGIGGDEAGVPTTTLLAVGDIMLSRNVATKIEKANDPELPFANLKKIISSADISFGNLECPLDPGNLRIREGLIFRCLTKDFEGVIAAGFDVLATANNHALDQGLDNLEFTIDYLKSRNILPVGTTPSYSPPIQGTGGETAPLLSPPPKEGGDEEGVILERNGVKFGFLAYGYSARNDGGKSTHSQISTMHDPSILQSEISNLQLRGADVIIISMHAGTEYTRNPNQDQIDFARAAIDAGADIVLGHHPHWIQSIEKYCPKPHLASPYQGEETTENSPPLQGGVRGGGIPCGLIFYSLGNFVFDQMWSQETREGLMVELEFRAKILKQAKLIPIVIDNYCCPRLADEKEKAAILRKINLASDLITF